MIEDELDTECVNVKLCTKYVIGNELYTQYVIEDELFTKYAFEDKHFKRYVIEDKLYAECVNVRPETLDTLLGLSPIHCHTS